MLQRGGTRSCAQQMAYSYQAGGGTGTFLCRISRGELKIAIGLKGNRRNKVKEHSAAAAAADHAGASRLRGARVQLTDDSVRGYVRPCDLKNAVDVYTRTRMYQTESLVAHARTMAILLPSEPFCQQMRQSRCGRADEAEQMKQSRWLVYLLHDRGCTVR